MPSPKTPPKAPAAIAAAVLLAAPLTAAYEGLRTKPYRDPAPKHTLTVCYGETKVPMRAYSSQECAVLLEARQRKDFAPPVLRCVPEIGANSYIFASAIDAAYNAGPGNFCKSPMAAAFNAGDWAKGCNAYLGWHVAPGGKLLPGLVKRRQAERATCLEGLA